MRKKKKISSPVKKKIILLLELGVALNFVFNPKTQRKVFKSFAKEWKNIDRQYLYRVIKEFHEERLVDYCENRDGSVKIVITEKGKKTALQFQIDKIHISKPLRWDKKWRIAFFDVPEKRKGVRDIFRSKLKELGFFEYQKSVFIHPYPCKNELNFVIEYFQLRSCVRFGIIQDLTNEAELKVHFRL